MVTTSTAMPDYSSSQYHDRGFFSPVQCPVAGPSLSGSTDYGSLGVFDSLIYTIPDLQPPTEPQLSVAPSRRATAFSSHGLSGTLHIPSCQFTASTNLHRRSSPVRRHSQISRSATTSHTKPYAPIEQTPLQSSFFPPPTTRTALKLQSPGEPPQGSPPNYKRVLPTQPASLPTKSHASPFLTPTSHQSSTSWSNPLPPLLFLSTPAPRTSSLSLITASPISPMTSSISTLASPPRHLVPLPRFSPFLPLTALVPPPYTFFSPQPSTGSNPPLFPPEFEETFTKIGVFRKYDSLLVEKSRGWRKWERGYWRLDLRGWAHEKDKRYFWEQMKEHVTRGRAGMVMVCLESEDIEHVSISQSSSSQAAIMSPSQGKELEEKGNIVRIYCWGGAAKCVWGMIYAYGNRRMQGIQWVDAGGRVIVRF